MPRYVCAVLLASTLLLRPPPAAADPICHYVGTTGSLLGERVLANPCIGYDGTIICAVATPGVSLVGLVLVICYPLA